jgi:hypothetical protein
MWGGGSKITQAATNDVNALSCPNAMETIKFSACLDAWEPFNGKTGFFVLTNPGAPYTAFVRVTGTYTYTCIKSCLWEGQNISYNFVKPDGTPATTGADFAATDVYIYANMRNAGGPLAGPIHIPPAYGTSPIGNDVFAADSSTGINVALGQLGINTGNIPFGTTIMVTWQDGSTAQFIRSNSVPTLTWIYVPGSAKDSGGNPINITLGTMIQNPHTGGIGSGFVIPTDPNQWYLYFQGGNSCTGSATLTIPGDGDYNFDFFFPC